MSKKAKASKIPTGATAKTAEQVQNTLGLRSSGAATKFDTRPRGTRTRQGAKRAAIAYGW